MKPRKKTWREKLDDDKGLPRVCRIDATKCKSWGVGTFLIPAAREVDDLMRRVRKGKLTTIDEIRKALAARHGTTIACPLTTGIFAWIAAHAAEETRAAGGRRVTPYWRTLKAKGELNPKYPGGIESLRRTLTAEGHRVIQKEKRYYVQHFEARLARLSTGLPSKPGIISRVR